MSNIFHIDMDAFFVSIETSINKNIINKPVAVGGNKKESVISSANYIARKYGVRSAMPTVIAKSLCSELIIIDINQDRMQHYINISDSILKLLKRKISKTIEIGSIDEWYLDISNTKLISLPKDEISYLIKKEIKDNFNLDCTIGCSFNKYFAKIATDLSKPNGYLLIDEKNYKDIIWDLNIDKMPYIGINTLPILINKNILTIGDLANYSNDNEMISLIGNKWIEHKRIANGYAIKSLTTSNNLKSIGKSTSFYEPKLYEEIILQLNNMTFFINHSLINKQIDFRIITLSFKLSSKRIVSKSKNKDHYNSQIDFNDIKIMLEQLVSKINISEIKICSLNVSKLKEKFLIDIQQNIFTINENNQAHPNQKINSTDLIKILNKKFDKKIFYSGKDKLSKN
ncbi:MAG: DNA polymerase IV [Malacoplasma sp.]